MLFYAFKPGTTADTFVDALAERAAAGLEVKVAVDAVGSAIDSTSRRLYDRLRAAGRPGGLERRDPHRPARARSATGRSSSTSRTPSTSTTAR